MIDECCFGVHVSSLGAEDARLIVSWWIDAAWSLRDRVTVVTQVLGAEDLIQRAGIFPVRCANQTLWCLGALSACWRSHFWGETMLMLGRTDGTNADAALAISFSFVSRLAR